MWQIMVYVIWGVGVVYLSSLWLGNTGSGGFFPMREGTLWQRIVAEAGTILLSIPALLILPVLWRASGHIPELWQYAGYASLCLGAVAVSYLQSRRQEQTEDKRQAALRVSRNVSGEPELSGEKRLHSSWFLHVVAEEGPFVLLLPGAGVVLAVLTAVMCRMDGWWFVACVAELLLIWVGTAEGTWLFIRQKLMSVRERALLDWQRESREYMNTIRSQRHDFNLHVHALTGLMDSGDYEECRAYLHRMAAEAADVNDIMPVNDAVVGSMLYRMREKARSQGTDIIYRITYDMSDTLCSGFELNKIIGNLLQNAIDAVVTEEDKTYGIHMSLFRRRGNTVITVENRFVGDRSQIQRAFEVGYSTKKHHEGIGLSMVQRTLKLHGGRIYPEFEGDRLRFVVNIPNRIRLDGTDEETYV